MGLEIICVDVRRVLPNEGGLMIYFSLLVSFLFVSFAYSTPARITDGKVMFAYGEVNGHICWNEAEFLTMQTLFDQFSATGTISSIVYSPNSIEVALSSKTKFNSYGDWKTCGSKKNMRKRVIEAHLEYQAIEDQDSRAKYEWLKSYRNSLP